MKIKTEFSPWWSTMPDLGQPGRGVFEKMIRCARSVWHNRPIGTKTYEAGIKRLRTLYKQLQKETGRKRHRFGTFDIIVRTLLKDRY